MPNYKGSSYKNGTDACQWPWYDGSEQKWSVQKIGDGTYKMTNLKSNQVLTIPNYSGSSYKNGTNACQWPWYDGSEQKWNLEKIGDNTYKIINEKSKQVLTIPNYNNSASLYKNGTNACQWSWYGGNEQKWKFELLQEL
nr:RICIN domain-containing protein [Pedobacter endophyticus]